MRLLGAVLAGGRSRRFGSPKALARLHGRPLWQVARGRLAAVCDRVVVVANDSRVAKAVEDAGDSRAPGAGERVGVVADRHPHLGPLAGIQAALGVAAADGMDAVLVLAVDMPWVPRDALARLASAWRAGGGRSAVVPRVAPGRPAEPLCAVYPASALAAAARALEEGRRAAGDFARSLRAVAVDARAGADGWTGPGAPFASVNAPGDLPPPAVSVVGNKNSGKTTLVVRLVAELGSRGRRVMSAKHGHNFRVDTPGADSWRHRHEGGAERVLLAGPAGLALVGGWAGRSEPPLDALLVRHLAGAEIVVAEGFRAAAAPKVEVLRASAQAEAVFGPARARAAGVLCAVTDQPDARWTVPVFDAAASETASQVADLVEAALLPPAAPRSRRD